MTSYWAGSILILTRFPADSVCFKLLPYRKVAWLSSSIERSGRTHHFFFKTRSTIEWTLKRVQQWIFRSFPFWFYRIHVKLFQQKSLYLCFRVKKIESHSIYGIHYSLYQNFPHISLSGFKLDEQDPGHFLAPNSMDVVFSIELIDYFTDLHFYQKKQHWQRVKDETPKTFS